MEIVDLQPNNTVAIEQAAQALIAGFREHAPDAWPDLVEARSEVHKALESGKICRVACDADGTVLGWIGGQPTYARVWELHPLVVVPSAQRHGIGRALVTDLEAQVRQRGGLTLMCRETIKLPSWYDRISARRNNENANVQCRTDTQNP